MSISISIRDLHKAYGESSDHTKRQSGSYIRALDGVSLELAEGERLGIVGENGAGKSTLLRILAGLSQPNSGDVAITGRVHAALTVGLGLREEMTGRENLLLDAELQGVNSENLLSRIDEMVAFAELGEFIDRPVRTYSSGMKGRLSFTSLVFVEPEILLIDETLSTGDQWFQRKAKAAVHDLCSRGKIVIIVSHGLQTIVEMCSRCIWLRDGKIVADGDPSHVTADYSAYQRRRSEVRLAQEFSRRAESWAAATDVEISQLSLGSTSGSTGLHVFRPDDSISIDIELAVHRPISSPEVRISFDRIDGLCVSENHSPPSLLPDRFPVGRYGVKAEVDRLSLGPGLFVANVELREGAELLARRSVSFKVDIDHFIIGGRPVLLVPIHTSVSQALS